MKCEAACVMLVLCIAAPARAQPVAAAKARFDQALTALHDFEYEQANAEFLEAERLDPRFALAYWGEAMTYDQLLWHNENVEAGRRALAKLAPTPAARAGKAANARDRGLLAAADVLFGDGDSTARHERYAAAMRALDTAFPADADVASLYALALMGNMSRSLMGTGGTMQDVRLPGLAGSEVQRTVAAILTRVLASHPEHHGALHYLLHDYDDPAHAPLALPAARAYARIAGGASHALHMPSHIFLQLGLWQDAAASDRASYAASNAWVHRQHLALALRNYHALSWLQYELLQLGRYAEARETIAEIEPIAMATAAPAGAPAGQHQPLLADLSSMRARYVIESRRWNLVANQTTFGNVNELFAIGMGAARTGNLRVAEQVRQALADRSTAPQEGDMRPAIAIMEREVAGLIALAAGRRDDAIAILQAAARAENELPAPMGLPAPVKPAPELLGEVLVEAGRPADAYGPFADALKRHPNRSLSLLGLARAAAANGDDRTARARYRQLLANFTGADADLPELKEGRAALQRPASTKKPAPRTRGAGEKRQP